MPKPLGIAPVYAVRLTVLESAQDKPALDVGVPGSLQHARKRHVGAAAAAVVPGFNEIIDETRPAVIEVFPRLPRDVEPNDQIGGKIIELRDLIGPSALEVGAQGGNAIVLVGGGVVVVLAGFRRTRSLSSRIP